MDDHGASDNRVGAVEANELVGEVELGDAVLVGGHVAQVAHVSLLVLGTAVRLAERIEVSSGANAAVCGVAELVHVEAVQTLRQTLDFAMDAHRCIGILSCKQIDSIIPYSKWHKRCCFCK